MRGGPQGYVTVTDSAKNGLPRPWEGSSAPTPPDGGGSPRLRDFCCLSSYLNVSQEEGAHLGLHIRKQL